MKPLFNPNSVCVVQFLTNPQQFSSGTSGTFVMCFLCRALAGTIRTIRTRPDQTSSRPSEQGTDEWACPASHYHFTKKLSTRRDSPQNRGTEGETCTPALMSASTCFLPVFFLFKPFFSLFAFCGASMRLQTIEQSRLHFLLSAVLLQPPSSVLWNKQPRCFVFLFFHNEPCCSEPAGTAAAAAAGSCGERRGTGTADSWHICGVKHPRMSA